MIFGSNRVKCWICLKHQSSFGKLGPFCWDLKLQVLACIFLKYCLLCKNFYISLDEWEIKLRWPWLCLLVCLNVFKQLAVLSFRLQTCSASSLHSEPNHLPLIFRITFSIIALVLPSGGGVQTWLLKLCSLGTFILHKGFSWFFLFKKKK